MRHRDHHHKTSDSDRFPQDYRPYWRRVHRDWRAWVVFALMLAGMIIYVLSDNLSFRARRQPQQPVPSALGGH
jgi:hypothetical protein